MLSWISGRRFYGALNLETRLDMRDYCRRHRLRLDCSLVTILKEGVINHYTFEYKPKKHGGYRMIAKPSPTLSAYQGAILERVLYSQMPSPVAHGGVPGRGIASCVAPHKGAHALLCVDLADAFGSVSFYKEVARKGYDNLRYRPHAERIESIFDLEAQELQVLLELTHLYDEDGRAFLPQGAPTSPHLFNLALRPLHEVLLRLAKHTGGWVTQYFDDIFFSLPAQTIPPKVRRAIFRMISENHLRLAINRQKVRYYPFANTANWPLRIVGTNLINGETRLPKRVLRE